MQDRTAANSDLAKRDAHSSIRPERRIVIIHVRPQVVGGSWPVKICIGEPLNISADIFTDGHGQIYAQAVFQDEAGGPLHVASMQPLGNDRWAATFTPQTTGSWRYTIQAWHNEFAGWCNDAKLRLAAGQPMDVEFQIARAKLAEAIADAADETHADQFQAILTRFDSAANPQQRLALLDADETRQHFIAHGPRPFLSDLAAPVPVRVERKRAGFSAWYELMPRSQSGSAERHGTFDDVIARLPYVKQLGFDVLYFPPIHPIGITNRKGRNNSLTAKPGEPGSPYAIGSKDGGHDAIHPELGSFADFARLISAAKDHGLEIALDFAIQCSPDHPWIKEHPEWFDWLPDGSIRFAENPPKKYEDIVNVHFYGSAYPKLWEALRDVVLFWVGEGVKIFRVDNPHTKPYPFWEWLIAEVQAVEPDAIFLAEAFTRPNIMKHLAKIGFTQSYSYFTWRDTKQELTDYLTELTQGSSAAYMRPNFFVNTPDINPHYLQKSGRAGFRVRAVLAATLGASYGIYSGFELCEAAALPGKEEYLNSEKYEIRAWDWDRPGNIREDIARINALRNAHAALQTFANVTFYNAWSDHIIYYGKATPDKSSVLLFAVNLDPHNPQAAHFEVPLWEFGLPDDASIAAENLISGERLTWSGKVQHMLLDPETNPYAMWRLLPLEARQ